MDMFKAMGAMRNPQGYVMQRAMESMVRQNPDAWKAAQEKYGNMSRADMLKALRKEYRRQGQDLDAIARQYGIPLK